MRLRKRLIDWLPEWCYNYSPFNMGYNYYHYIFHPWEFFEDCWLEIKWFYQRGKRGYSDRDVWNWCHYQARINSGALRQLAKHKYGRPIGVTFSKWNKILLNMANGFQCLIDDDNDVTSYKKLSHKQYLALVKLRYRKLDFALKAFRKYYYNLWD